MILAETIFVDSQPIGMIRQDSNTGLVAFSPTNGTSLLPDQPWASVDELKSAVIAAYYKPVKEESLGGDTEAFSFFGKKTNHAQRNGPDR